MENPSPKPTQTIDWLKCILCQLDTKEPLTSPTRAGYKTIAQNIIQFNELDCMPIQIVISHLDHGNGIEATFMKQNAKWHKSCYLKFGTSKLDRAKERKRKSVESNATSSKRIFTRSCLASGDSDTSTTGTNESRICFFCSKPETKEKLREVCTFDLDYRVRKCAHDLQDEELLAKLSTRDLIALEAKYHARCLTNLYNKARAIGSQDQNTCYNDQTCKGIALAELISYIEDSRQEDIKVFRLADLTKLYSERLDQLGIDVTRINSTYLKDRILMHIPDMKAYNEGRDVFLAYSDDVGTVLRQGYKADRDELSVMMTKIAHTIRNDIFLQKVTFSGSFDQMSQVESVPQSLLSLVSMLINGSNITDQTRNINLSQPVLTIAQLVVFNSIKKRRDHMKVPKTYHSKERETPLPIYMGLKVHALTRERKLVDSLFALGVSASYDRVMDIVTALGNNVCDYYQQIGTVCPPQIRRGQFITAAADNIDHNPSSATSTGSFHGTSLSLFQNVAANSTVDDADHGFNHSITPVKRQRKVMDLPHVYSEVKPTGLPTGEVYVPVSVGDLTSNCDTLSMQIQKEYDWLNHVNDKLQAHECSSTSNISWAAYHASLIAEPDTLPSINAMLPLFAEEASSPSMLRHCFDVIKAAVQYINPGQIPVISVDQPLFAKMKQLQWSMDRVYGEDKFVLLLGGLHIEMTGYKALGHWLEGSGWVEALQEAEIATAGIADSFLKASHITRTRHAHQVTVCTLYILLEKAYDVYTTNRQEEGPPQSFDQWCAQKKTESPQFLYWFTCLELELLVLAFVRSLRVGDFNLYVDTLTKLIPWFFCLNHTNYSRWLPVHVRDMCSLDTNHPDIAQEFRNGKFVMAKSMRKFSLIAIDHGHEQNNGVMKEEGGIIGLTQDVDALLRWAVAGPELVRVISEFEFSMIGKTEDNTNTNHHEQTETTQIQFAKQVYALVEVIFGMGNPFEEESQDMLRLHSKDIMGQDSVECLTMIQMQGQEQYMRFVEERLRTKTKAITAPITRNKVVLFNEQPKKTKKSAETVTLLKNESSLFSRLYVACQTRDGDLDTFFSHENHPFPPSLSSYGQLRLGKKSDLMGCLEQHAQGTCNVRPPTDATIMDGAVLVNLLRPGGCKTFGDYALKVFIPYVQREHSLALRVDIVWDQYYENSLKGQTREKRVSGPSHRRRVEMSSPVPKNWQHFLRVNSNKAELFKLLNNELMKTASTGQVFVVTEGADVRCIPSRDKANIAPCNHEEADSRIMVHVSDAVMQGFQKILVRTVDTDVVVLAVSTVQKLENVEVWIAFGTGKDFRYVPAHEISLSLGPRKSLALPVFHALTGCDTVSHFAQVGKKTAWKIWEAHDEFTDTFYEMHNAPEQIPEEINASLEYFTILLYDRTSTCSSINEVRKLLFTRKGRQMSTLPPSKAALQQHIRRAVLQGGHYWGCATMPNRLLPSPADWGWTCPEQWMPLWTNLPQASASCPELLQCRCRTRCGDCKCTRAHLKCTVYCTCRGDCDNM